MLHLTSGMLDPIRTPSSRAFEEQLTYTLEDTWGGHLLVAGEERRVFTQQDVSSGSVLFVETASRAANGSLAGFDFTASTKDSPAVHEHFSVDVLPARVTGAVVEAVRAGASVTYSVLFGNVRKHGDIDSCLRIVTYKSIAWLQGGAVSISSRMLSLGTETMPHGDVVFDVRGTKSGQLLVNGKMANQFLQSDVDDGRVQFLQQDRPRRMYDGSAAAGFEFSVVRQGSASRPMFFPISVIEDTVIPVPQVKSAPVATVVKPLIAERPALQLCLSFTPEPVRA